MNYKNAFLLTLGILLGTIGTKLVSVTDSIAAKKKKKHCDYTYVAGWHLGRAGQVAYKHEWEKVIGKGWRLKAVAHRARVRLVRAVDARQVVPVVGVGERRAVQVVAIHSDREAPVAGTRRPEVLPRASERQRVHVLI